MIMGSRYLPSLGASDAGHWDGCPLGVGHLREAVGIFRATKDVGETKRKILRPSLLRPLARSWSIS